MQSHNYYSLGNSSIPRSMNGFPHMMNRSDGNVMNMNASRNMNEMGLRHSMPSGQQPSQPLHPSIPNRPIGMRGTNINVPQLAGSRNMTNHGNIGMNMMPNYPSNDSYSMIAKQGNSQMIHQQPHLQLPQSNPNIPVQQQELPRFDLSDFPALGADTQHNRQAMPTQSSSQSSMKKDEMPRFDLSDFPALGTPSGSQHTSSSAVPPISNVNRGFSLEKEEFPSLGASFPSSAYSASHTFGQSKGILNMNPPTDQDSWHSQKQQPIDTKGSAEIYGLNGLLTVIRMTDPDLNVLALGTDLTTLGFNLNSQDALYSTFSSPWSDGPSKKEPDYILPYCYYMNPPALKTSHLTKFQLETLFYIFYNMPKDSLQVYAAKELYNREWRYHKELKIWVKQTMDSNMKGGQSYVYFDINTWERRIFHDTISQPLKFMEESEIRSL